MHPSLRNLLVRTPIVPPSPPWHPPRSPHHENTQISAKCLTMGGGIPTGGGVVTAIQFPPLPLPAAHPHPQPCLLKMLLNFKHVSHDFDNPLFLNRVPHAYLFNHQILLTKDAVISNTPPQPKNDACNSNNYSNSNSKHLSLVGLF